MFRRPRFIERSQSRRRRVTARADSGAISGILVIGGGIAGQAVVEAVRARDTDVPLTLVGAEPRLPYDRVRLSEILVSGQSAADLVLRPPEWYDDHDIDVRMGARLDALPTGRRIALCTGSDPLLPPLPGLELAGVHPFRDPEDCDAIRAAAATARRAVVIGGGLLGLEAARGIAAQACDVTVVHLVERLMERQLDAGAASLLPEALAALGIEVLLERETVALSGQHGHVDGVVFADGSRLDAELVVVSIGIRPQVSLARDAGLAIGRGVLVDDRLRTSAPGIVAVGECAEHDGVVYGLVAPILEQARVATEELLDSAPDRSYRGSVPSATLKVAGIDLVCVGDAQGASEAVTSDAAAGVYRKLSVRDGVAVGAILLGDVRGADALTHAVRSAQQVADPLARLVAAAAAGPADLPDDAQVCDCNGVCKSQIVAAVDEAGASTPREVMAMTRAGTGCGSCKPTVVELVAIAAGGLVEEPTYLCACERQTRVELAEAIRAGELDSVSAVSERHRTGRACGACKPALAYLVSEVNANRHREERDARYINDRVHANIQKDGTFSVVPRMYGGVTTPAELRRIADVAERYDVPLVKVTGGQRLDLLGVRKEDLPAIWGELGMPSGHAYTKAVRTVKTCVGTDFCRYGLGDSMGLGIEMERAWEGLYTPHKVKSGVSGCARNCAEATVKDIGAVCVGEDRWQVRVGGAAGGNVREADILAEVGSRAEALRVATTFLQYYRENAEYRERTYDFVPRIGLDVVREAVLDEASGAALRERFRLAKAATLDPWLERDAPYHPRQFTDLDGEPAVVGPPPEGRR